MTPTILAICMAATALGAIGLVLVVVAARLRAQVGRPKRCPCCGYASEGLEEEVCPECGGAFELTVRAAVRRRRRVMAVAGCMCMGAGLLAFPVVEATRGGVAHALPSVVLIEGMRWTAAERWGADIELQVRADSGRLGAWERGALARACAEALESRSGATTRRTAAMLAMRVAREAEDRTIRLMLADGDPAVRACGVQALERSERAGAWARRALMSMACEDRSPLVRKRAVDAVRGVEGTDVQSMLVGALEDPNEGVRERATYALGARRAEPSSAMALAVASVWDIDDGVRAAARWALGRLAGEPATGERGA